MRNVTICVLSYLLSRVAAESADLELSRTEYHFLVVALTNLNAWGHAVDKSR